MIRYMIDNMREEYDFSQGTRGAVLHHDGETRITLWVDTEVLEWFRAMAEREGRGYQTAMRTALRGYRGEKEQNMEKPLNLEIGGLYTMYRDRLNAIQAENRIDPINEHLTSAYSEIVGQRHGQATA